MKCCFDCYIHILINNGSHESVGGMPTVALELNFEQIAKACGYKYVVSVDNFDDLEFAEEINLPNKCQNKFLNYDSPNTNYENSENNKIINLLNLNTASVVDMEAMFYNCFLLNVS